MTRRRRIVTILGAAAGALALLLGLLFYTPPGLTLVARLVGPLSGGTVRLAGLGGVFPNHLTAARVDVADEKGVWLRIADARLDWSALAALFNHIDIDSVEAARIQLLRRPLPSRSKGEGPAIDIARLSAPRIEIAAAVAGRTVALSARGSLHYVSRHDLAADLLIARLNSGDSYRIDAGVARDVAHGRVTIREGAGGILGALLGLPGLGPVNVAAQARGDAAANRLSFTASAGALTASGQGTIALAAGRADLDFRAQAPAMTPSADLSWQALSAEGHFHGSFERPRLEARIDLRGPRSGGFGAARLSVSARGQGGDADVTGEVEGMTVAGMPPDLFAGAPIRFEAHADLAATDRPVRFALTHPVLQASGQAVTRGGLRAAADVSLPDLAPFASGADTDLSGSGRLHLTATQSGGRLTLAADGMLRTGGAALAARLLGRAELTAQAVLEGGDIVQSRLILKGGAISGDLAGTLKQGVLAYRAALTLPDLSRLADTLAGTLTLQGTVNGPAQTAAVKAQGQARMAATGFAPRVLALDYAAQGLVPATARLSVDGALNDAPLRLAARLAQGRRLDLTAQWKSLDAAADLTWPQTAGAQGLVRLALGRLEDIAPFTGETLTGALRAQARLTARGRQSDATFDMRLSDLTAGDAALSVLTVQGSARDLFGSPDLSVTGQADGLATAGFAGSGRLRADGPLSALDAGLSLDLTDGGGVPATLDTTVRLDADRQRVTLSALKGTWRGGTLTLDGPATLTYGATLAVDRLAAHLGGGTLSASGSLSPALSLQARIDGVALEDFPRLLPAAGLRGTLSADVSLSGTLAAPAGQIAVTGKGLRAAATGSGATPASLTADIRLAGDHALVDAALKAGAAAELAVTGRAPLAADQPMALQARGTFELALLDPLLVPSGRRARGTVSLDAGLAGTFAAPRASGGATLSGGEIQDYARGIRVSAIAARLRADGTRLIVERLEGRAGPGSISGGGSVDLAAPGMPVDIRLTARQARPMVSDLFTATLNADLALKGRLADRLSLSGTADVLRGEINLPERFPPEVAVLDVRRRGQPPPPPPSTSRIALDVAVGASGPIFVRGHGVDAVMGGDFRLAGTTADPLISGGFRMQRGTYSLAGQTLTFTAGRVTFDGTGVRRRLDPRLDFTASTQSGGVTATLAVTGYASAPRIALSSSPPLPQDEIVARLLFDQSVKQLSPLQLASIAQAVASLGGVGGGGFDALGTVRRTLGLDRLSVGSSTPPSGAPAQSQTIVEAGRYVSSGVYVGVKQGLAGGTQTQVQVDITKRLKAQATVSAATSANSATGAAARDYGGSVGLSYQLEY